MADNSYASLMDPASERAKRGAFFFLMLFAGIIFAMWDLARFLWGGTAVPSTLSMGAGVGLSVLMLASLVPVVVARKKLDQGDDGGIIGNLATLIVISLVMIGGIVYNWTTLSIGSGYGGIYDITSLWFLVHFVAGILALLASMMKISRTPDRAKAERWVSYNVLTYWRGIVILWVAFFIVFYIA
ncbi:cytochrome C oxidase subunit III [Acidithiobacillus ferriphilus]|uniref:cytochrome C oxidase subunit III n=1 Tax=Acidithiobacillus ferriphilus TaxID=1689834 RepID=UPI0023314C2E|nr:cytochrome C oxidase subunit III [Acidithiobacillus ferriphilus]WCE92812.1 cytochrome C oxidase subunit III [Acidithiobacillus ferriphilus]WCE95098.1 cytochrome C oxidase subunit III [Acidithiobacillus ferriphilus]